VQVERAERRRDLQWTAAGSADGVAARAICLHENQASLRGRIENAGSSRRRRREGKQRCCVDGYSHAQTQ
jgi:hypothetical protein